MFTIYYHDQRGGFRLQLRITRLTDLFIHEGIVPGAFSRLINSFRNARALQHPIIIDNESNVVLDGTH